MSEIYLSSPTYYIIFGFIAALLISGTLYFKNLKEKEFSQTLKIVLALLRGTAVMLLFFLLLQPFIKKISTQSQKPILFFAQDVSASVKKATDSLSLASYLEAVEKTTSSLEKKYEVKVLSLGDKLREGLDKEMGDQSTKLSDVFDYVDEQYKDANKAAIVLASDGIYNYGNNPLYADKTGLAVHTILLGDTTSRKDLRIKRVFHNDIAYLDDRFNVLIDIASDNIQNGQSILRIHKGRNASGKLLFEEAITINNANFFQTVELYLDADKVGKQDYFINLSPIEGERSKVNNKRVFTIDVIDARQEVLLLASAPHPDIFALRSAMEAQGNLKLKTIFKDDIEPNLDLSTTDLVILHQLPGRAKGRIADILKKLKEKKTPIWYIVGVDTDISALNEEQNLLSVNDYIGEYNQSFARKESKFNLFTLSEELTNTFGQYPPLKVPFGTIKSQNGDVLLKQRIGSVDTEYPLFMFAEENGQKTAVLMGTGLWQWRIFHYLQNKNHNSFDELIQKTATYLGSKEDKRKFRVKPGKQSYLSSEDISFDAELFNANYERVNSSEVSMQITNEEGNSFNYTFSRNKDAYFLNAKKLTEGNYSYEAKTSFNGEQFSQKGSFSVADLNLEELDLSANTNMMKVLSENSSGNFYYANQLEELEQMLLEDERHKPMLYNNSQTLPLIEYRWIFAILLLLLGIEWFLRRFKGSY